VGRPRRLIEGAVLRKLIGLITLLDGAVTVLWGPGFLRWQRGLAPRWYYPVLDWLLGWPSLFLRAGAACEALLGWVLINAKS